MYKITNLTKSQVSIKCSKVEDRTFISAGQSIEVEKPVNYLTELVNEHYKGVLSIEVAKRNRTVDKTDTKTKTAST
jgi:hypothetical protein